MEASLGPQVISDRPRRGLEVNRGPFPVPNFIKRKRPGENGEPGIAWSEPAREGLQERTFSDQGLPLLV